MQKGTRHVSLLFAVVGLFGGCGEQSTDRNDAMPDDARAQAPSRSQTTVAVPQRQMRGRYEAMPVVPRTQIPGADPKLQKQLDAQMRQLQEMGRMILEFDGSKARMGTAAALVEYDCHVKGNRLELIANGMGSRVIVPMTIEADGSITYMSFHFHRVR